nr:nucleotide exchange factor GrpE [uncultured Actinoplanes sp.]
MTDAPHRSRPQDAGAAGPQDAAAGTGPGVAELEDRWQRAVAEVDNLRKRFERQLTEQARTERARTAGAFLPVVDNLELALRHADADPAAIVAGVRGVHAQALDVLEALGYRRIDALGDRFDPALHEAARSAPAGDGCPPGTVVEVHRAGYTDAGGALVRPAVVTVAQAAEPDAGPVADEPQGAAQNT